MIERYRDVDVPRFFRGDAAFTIPELYDLLEADGYEYEIRLKANAVLERHVGHLLTRPVGRTPKRPQRFYHSFDANEAWLQLHVLAYNLGNFLRRLALPPSVKQWSLTTRRDKLIKIGATVVHHDRLRHVSTGRGRGAAPAVPRDP